MDSVNTPLEKCIAEYLHDHPREFPLTDLFSAMRCHFSVNGPALTCATDNVLRTIGRRAHWRNFNKGLPCGWVILEAAQDG